MWYNGYGGFGGYRMMNYGWMPLVMFGIILLVVFLIIYFSRVHYHRRSYDSDSSIPNSNALNILDERYAKGEISDEEYKIKKSEIYKKF